jgi:hypothetical protein
LFNRVDWITRRSSACRQTGQFACIGQERGSLAKYNYPIANLDCFFELMSNKDSRRIDLLRKCNEEIVAGQPFKPIGRPASTQRTTRLAALDSASVVGVMNRFRARKFATIKGSDRQTTDCDRPHC